MSDFGKPVEIIDIPIPEPVEVPEDLPAEEPAREREPDLVPA